MAEVSLELIAELLTRQQQEIRELREDVRALRTDMEDMRDQMIVLTNMVIRVDSTTTALLTQNRLTERRFAKLEKRMDAFEGAP